MEAIIDFICHDIDTSIELSARNRLDKDKVDFEYTAPYSKELFDINGITVTPQLIEKIKTSINPSKYTLNDIEYKEVDGENGDKIYEFTIKGSLKQGENYEN